MIARARMSLILGLLLAAGPWTFPGTASAGSGHERDRALRELTASVEQTRVTRAEDGSTWLEAVIRTGSGERVRLRIAPTEILDASEFVVAEGSRLRVRFFVEEDPAGVQRIRNLETGRTLRLRCLHGEPLWDRLQRGGPGGSRHPDRRGHGHHGGR